VSKGDNRRSHSCDDRKEIKASELVKLLVSHYSRPEVRSVRNRNEEEIVCDIEVDDLRCFVYRSRGRQGADGWILSPRETEVVQMVAAGHSNKIIADKLNISAFTVSTYLRRIFAKVGVRSRAAMIARNYEGGITKTRRSAKTCREVLSQHRLDSMG
jgi:DNA-binding CsgD family transcriptional regulator